MRKQVFGRRFRRDSNERQALFKSLISALVLEGSIKTTEEKAKAIKGDIDRLVTKAKKGDLSKRLLQPYLKPGEIEKLIKEIAPSFAKRQGGYTRTVRLGRRFSDNASLVLMRWAEGEEVQKESPKTPAKKTAKPKTAKPVKKTEAKRATKKRVKKEVKK